MFIEHFQLGLMHAHKRTLFQTTCLDSVLYLLDWHDSSSLNKKVNTPTTVKRA